MRLYNAPDAKAVDLILGAEEWAKMMQVAMREGMSVAEAADATRELSCMHLASGFTATEIIQLLERHWHHGKELAEWHRRAW